MTLRLLREEYTQVNPHHYSYSRFTVLYKTWKGSRQLSMRQVHHAGDKLFIDYCGPTLSVVNPKTGEVRSSQVFVAELGPVLTPMPKPLRPDWLGSHARVFDSAGSHHSPQPHGQSSPQAPRVVLAAVQIGEHTTYVVEH